MLQLKFSFFLFFLAAVSFVSKPFVGFGLHQAFTKTNRSHSVVAKSFTKRKPEYLEEANVKKAEISARLTNPPVEELISIVKLLAILFLSVLFLKRTWHLSSSPNTFYPIYLLTGKLII